MLMKLTLSREAGVLDRRVHKILEESYYQII